MASMGTKNSIRKEKLLLRANLSQEERGSKDEAIRKKVLELSCVKEADTILCYASYQSEVSTDKLVCNFLQIGKKVFLPRVNGEEMDFCRIESMEDLTEGYKGIPEPSKECSVTYIPDKAVKAVMIMPGCAFSREGFRIGYGKGYYDRYLDKCDMVERVALCYSLQLTDDIEPDAHDKKATCLVTEDEVIVCN